MNCNHNFRPKYRKNKPPRFYCQNCGKKKPIENKENQE